MRGLTAEGGYTLAELLVVTAILGMVAAAVFGVFQVSLQGYTRATSLEDAQLGARAGVDRMVTELRLAGNYWMGTGAIAAATSSSITFLGDVDADTINANGNEVRLNQPANIGDTQIVVDRTTGADGSNAFAAGEYVHIAGGANRAVRQIASGYTSGTTIPLTAAITIPGFALGAMVRSVETVTYAVSGSSLTRNGLGIVDSVTGLTLSYYDANGTSLGPSPNLALIREIQISLTVQGSDGSRRTMTSWVRPRNLQ